jgi:hypothetical protein
MYLVFLLLLVNIYEIDKFETQTFGQDKALSLTSILQENERFSVLISLPKFSFIIPNSAQKCHSIFCSIVVLVISSFQLEIFVTLQLFSFPVLVKIILYFWSFHISDLAVQLSTQSSSVPSLLFIIIGAKNTEVVLGVHKYLLIF